MDYGTLEVLGVIGPRGTGGSIEPKKSERYRDYCVEPPNAISSFREREEEKV